MERSFFLGHLRKGELRNAPFFQQQQQQQQGALQRTMDTNYEGVWIISDSLHCCRTAAASGGKQSCRLLSRLQDVRGPRLDAAA